MIISALNIAACLPAIFGNLVVISVILFNKQLQTRPNFLVCCLAVTDLAVGLILQPLLSLHLMSDLSGISDCLMADAVYYLTSVICGASCLTLVLISYDRYLHLVKLLKYNDFMTRRKLCILVVSCWLVPIVEGFFLFDSRTLSVFFVLIIISTVCDSVALFFCYKQIYAFVKKKSMVIPARSSPGDGDSNEHAQFKSQSRLAKNFFILVACFVACWTPLKIVLVYLTFVSISGTSATSLSSYINTLHCIAIIIGIFNSSLNPLIYFWKNRALRDRTRAVFKQAFCGT